MIRKIYLSPLGVFISLVLNFFGRLLRPFMVYGYWDANIGKLRKTVRFSSSTAFVGERKKLKNRRQLLDRPSFDHRFEQWREHRRGSADCGSQWHLFPVMGHKGKQFYRENLSMDQDVCAVLSLLMQAVPK